jgi:hypothetical protein
MEVGKAKNSRIGVFLHSVHMDVFEPWLLSNIV